MAYFEGESSANIVLASQNPYDGGITAHGVSGSNEPDNSIFDDFGDAPSQAAAGTGASFQEAAAGYGNVEQAMAGEMTQAAAGIPARMYSGTGEITQALAAVPSRVPARMYSGTGELTQAAAGIPARMYSGYDAAGQSRAYSGIPARMYSGFGITPEEFNPDQVWADILKSNEKDANGNYTPAANAAGTRWAIRVKAALAALGYGYNTRADIDASWGNNDVAFYRAWALKSGLTPTPWGIPSKEHVQALAAQLKAGKPTGPQAPIQVDIVPGPGGTSRGEVNPGGGAKKAGMLFTFGLVALAGVAAVAYFAKKKKGEHHGSSGSDIVVRARPNKKGRKSRRR